MNIPSISTQRTESIIGDQSAFSVTLSELSIDYSWLRRRAVVSLPGIGFVFSVPVLSLLFVYLERGTRTEQERERERDAERTLREEYIRYGAPGWRAGGSFGVTRYKRRRLRDSVAPGRLAGRNRLAWRVDSPLSFAAGPNDIAVEEHPARESPGQTSTGEHQARPAAPAASAEHTKPGSA